MAVLTRLTRASGPDSHLSTSAGSRGETPNYRVAHTAGVRPRAELEHSGQLTRSSTWEIYGEAGTNWEKRGGR